MPHGRPGGPDGGKKSVHPMNKNERFLGLKNFFVAVCRPFDSGFMAFRRRFGAGLVVNFNRSAGVLRTKWTRVSRRSQSMSLYFFFSDRIKRSGPHPSFAIFAKTSAFFVRRTPAER